MQSLTSGSISYSLGDAINWKRNQLGKPSEAVTCISYSLGDVIDWKPLITSDRHSPTIITYSLGEAINWKQ